MLDRYVGAESKSYEASESSREWVFWMLLARNRYHRGSSEVLQKTIKMFKNRRTIHEEQ